MKQILFRYNPWWENENFAQKMISREKLLNQLLIQLSNNQVIYLTGLRRIGKTSLMKLLIDNLIQKQNIKAQNILYVSLDNYLLQNNTIFEIIDEFRAIHRHKFEDFLYLFFDEVTYREDFELQLKNVVDNQNVKIFASSSSASLMKSRKPHLTGRSRIIEILPLDFEEFLLFKNIHLSFADENLLKTYFTDFLKTGGIPEYVLRNDIAYIQELIDDIIFKDIVSHYNLRSNQVLKDFFLLLMERAGKQLSLNKIAKILFVSPDTARRYMEYFADTFLVYQVARHGTTNERLLSQKKVYAPDIGIRNFFTGYRDTGSVFENYVFLKIKHLNPKYLYENATEIDFFTENKMLLEIKFHDLELSPKQQKLFDETTANYKFVVRNYKDIDSIIATSFLV